MVTKLFPYDSAADTTPGAHVAADLDNTNNAHNAHTAATAAHGATGANVGTTNSQTLSNKTLSAAVISDALTTVSIKREAVTGDVNLAADTVIAGVSTLSASITITLTTAAITAQSGRIWHIKDETGVCGNAYTITIATEGAETIDGQATHVIISNYGSTKLYSNGTNLFILEST